MTDPIPEDEDGDSLRATFMKDVKYALRLAGFPATGICFPYSLHHNFYRAKIRIDGKKAKHFHIAHLLMLWMRERTAPEDYAWQCVTGAVKEMISRNPSLVAKIPDDIRTGMASVEDGYAFLKWVKVQDVAALMR